MGVIYSKLLQLYNYICRMATGEEEEIFHFPKTLEEFNYEFDKDGKLQDRETKEPFKFVVDPDNHKYNQKRYEALGNIITDYVYKLLDDRNLKRVTIPVDADPAEPTSFFYMSEDALEKDNLLILIHGNGVVRAGQWARRLIINDCLDSGTQLPFIEWGIKEGYGVIVANTNYNKANDKKDGEEIRCSGSPEEHMECVWENFVKKSKAGAIGIVAHSYGGVVTLDLASNHIDEFSKRVFAIALTDSVHSFSHQNGDENVIQFYTERAKNWVSCLDELDTEIETYSDYCPTVAAGTDKHEYTSYSSMNSIFKFLSEKYKQMKESGGEKAESSEKESSVMKESPVTKETEEMAMSQDENISASQIDVEMDLQNPEGSQKQEL